MQTLLSLQSNIQDVQAKIMKKMVAEQSKIPAENMRSVLTDVGGTT